MKRFGKLLALLFISLISFSFIAEDAIARRGGGGFSRGGGSRSWGGSRRSSPSRSKSWSQPRKSSGTRKAASKKPAQRAKPQLSQVDKSAVARAKKNNTSFGNKNDAQKAFKEKHAAKYTQTPTPGKAAPATRPAHIPQTSQVNGKTVNINYNVSRGGYGHWSGGGVGLGTFMMYNAMADMTMMSILMRQNDYHYAGMYSRSAITTSPQVVVVHRSFVWIGFLVLGAIVVLAFVIVSVSNH